jgi:uncharacterized protein (DUF111 family)
MTKKGRWEHLFFVDVPEERLDAVVAFMVAELGTIGLRVFETQHIKYAYRTVQVRLVVATSKGFEPRAWPVSVKLICDGQGEVSAAKAEFEDLRAALLELAHAGVAVPFGDLKALVESTARDGKAHERGGVRAEPWPPELPGDLPG